MKTELNLWELRRTLAGPWTPTYAELSEVIIALHEASDKASADGRKFTADSYRRLRETIRAAQDGDPIETAFAARIEEDSK